MLTTNSQALSANGQDTICALSTAPGMGAIAVVRVSGSKALEYTSAIFSRDLTNEASHTNHFGRILATDGSILDEVLISVFHAGKSFTGEETTEIACHGSTFIQQQLLQRLIQVGCRLAEPGEFTMRAFLNGRMDLSQAEAVADLISAESKKAHEVAIRQMKGTFSKALSQLREQLIHFASLVELELDFAEEDVEFADRTELLALVIDVLQHVQNMMKSFELGNVLKTGIPVAIIGAPNSGKSTLLNQLLQEERAIVSPIAGTTRDVIEETMNIDGLLFRFIDTAGIRNTDETIESLGIARSYEKIEQAQLILLLVDVSLEASELEATIQWTDELQRTYPDKTWGVIANKVDLADSNYTEQYPHITLGISAKSGSGISELKAWLSAQVMGDFNTQTDIIVTNSRHVAALEKTAFSLEKARDGLNSGVTGDFVAMDIRQAMFHLGSITGDISTEDLLGNIFSKFCIGK